jgi:tRNA 2-thiouridine synthesizing protein A
VRAHDDIRFVTSIKTPVTGRDTIAVEPSLVGTPSRTGEEAMKTVNVDRQINLKGEVCPYTFVKSLLSLEEMEAGQVLRVVVDYLPSVENVPRSLKNEGHEIVEVAQINDTDWAITVRKLALDEEG